MPDRQPLAPRLELRHLRYFVAVAEELHFRRAAERLHISQPPLSQQIRALEKEIGVQLLVRTQRRVELTAAGERLLEEARGVLHGVDEAIAVSRRIAQGAEGLLTVGFVGSAMYGVLPTVIRTYRRRYPAVELALRELSTTEQLAALHERRIDVGFVRPPVPVDGLSTETIDRERVVVALPAEHHLTQRQPLALADLAGEPVVAMAEREAPGLRRQLREARKAIGGTPHIVQETAEIQTLIGLVASGLGFALVPSSVARLAREDVVYREIEGWTPIIELTLVWRAGEDAPARENFLAVARELAQ